MPCLYPTKYHLGLEVRVKKKYSHTQACQYQVCNARQKLWVPVLAFFLQVSFRMVQGGLHLPGMNKSLSHIQISHLQGWVVQSPRVSENINFSFVTFWLDNLFILFCPSVLSCSNLELHQTLQVKNIFKQEKIMLQSRLTPSNITSQINKMFMTLIYFKNSQSQKNCCRRVMSGIRHQNIAS